MRNQQTHRTKTENQNKTKSYKDEEITKTNKRKLKIHEDHLFD